MFLFMGVQIPAFYNGKYGAFPVCCLILCSHTIK